MIYFFTTEYGENHMAFPGMPNLIFLQFFLYQKNIVYLRIVLILSFSLTDAIKLNGVNYIRSALSHH